MKNLYDQLGVTPSSSKEEIKKAYRRLSMKFHPDKNDGDAFFADMFKHIQEAYSILSDDSKRDAYDRRYNTNSNSTNQEWENIRKEKENIRKEKEYINKHWENISREKEEINKQKNTKSASNSKNNKRSQANKPNDNQRHNRIKLSYPAYLLILVLLAASIIIGGYIGSDWYKDSHNTNVTTDIKPKAAQVINKDITIYDDEINYKAVIEDSTSNRQWGFHVWEFEMKDNGKPFSYQYFSEVRNFSGFSQAQIQSHLNHYERYKQVANRSYRQYAKRNPELKGKITKSWTMMFKTYQEAMSLLNKNEFIIGPE